MCFKEYLNLTLLFFKPDVSRLTGPISLIFNTSMCSAALNSVLYIHYGSNDTSIGIPGIGNTDRYWGGSAIG